MPEHIRQEPKVLVSTENLTEQEWLAYRRRGKTAEWLHPAAGAMDRNMSKLLKKKESIE